MNQPTSKAVAPVQQKRDIREFLSSQHVKVQIALALPKHMTPDRMIRVMLTTVLASPKLAACSQESLLSCLMKCSQYGLEPDGRHAHLIPYGDKCELIFDYKGLVALVRRSGEVSDIHCDVVYEKDEFEYSHGSNGKLIHKPAVRVEDPGAIFAAYSFVKLKDGSESFEVVAAWQIDKVMESSQGYRAFKSGATKSNPWDSNWAEMAKKTAFRRHTKWLPLSFELQEAINADDDKQSEEKRFASAKPVFRADLALTEPPSDPGTVLFPEPATTEAANQTAEPATPETTTARETKQEPKAKDAKSDKAAPAVEKTLPLEDSVKPQTELAQIVEGAGFTFSAFQIWAEETGNLPDASSLAYFDQVPTKDAARFVKASVGLINGLKTQKK